MSDGNNQNPSKPPRLAGVVYNPWSEIMQQSMRMGADIAAANIALYQSYWQQGLEFQRNLLKLQVELINKLGEDNARLALDWIERSKDPKELTVPIRDFLRDNQHWFRPFQKIIEEQFDVWKVPHISDISYEMVKEGIRTEEEIKQFWSRQIQHLPEPQKTWVRFMLMYNEEFRKAYRTEGAGAWLESIAILTPGDNRLSQPDRKNLFLTEDSHRNIIPVDEDTIVNMFPVADEVSPRREKFPRLLITSSHADGRFDSNMTDITHGIQALVRDTQGKELPLTHINGSVSAEPEKVLMLFASDSERNNSWNASRLQMRLRELDRNRAMGVPDEFKEVSPGAKRIARLMLRCMLQDPSTLDSYAKDSRSIKEIFANTDKQLLLRARPELVAQHFLLMGYSKGGNVVSDAIRYVMHELEATNANGKDIVATQHEHGHAYDISAHGTVSIRNIIRNIGCIAMAAIDKKLTDHEKELGFRRLFIKNIHDPIANQEDFDGDGLYDEKIDIVGADGAMAHEPKKAMGKLVRDIPEERRAAMNADEIKKEISGYIPNDVRVARRLREAFAPYCDKAALYDIRPSIDDNGRECIIIETAPGTTDEMFNEKKAVILKAMASPKVGNLKGVSLEEEGGNTGIFRLYFQDALFEPGSEELNPKTKAKLLKAFSKLRSPETAGLVIAQEIIKELGGPAVGVDINGQER